MQVGSNAIRYPCMQLVSQIITGPSTKYTMQAVNKPSGWSARQSAIGVPCMQIASERCNQLVGRQSAQ